MVQKSGDHHLIRSSSQYLQGFLHPGGDRRISSINSIVPWFWLHGPPFRPVLHRRKTRLFGTQSDETIKWLQWLTRGFSQLNSKFRPKSEGLRRSGAGAVMLAWRWFDCIYGEKVRQKSSYNFIYCLDTKCITLHLELHTVVYTDTARVKMWNMFLSPKNVLLQLHSVSFAQFTTFGVACQCRYWSTFLREMAWMVVELLESGGRNLRLGV